MPIGQMVLSKLTMVLSTRPTCSFSRNHYEGPGGELPILPFIPVHQHRGGDIAVWRVHGKRLVAVRCDDPELFARLDKKPCVRGREVQSVPGEVARNLLCRQPLAVPVVLIPDGRPARLQGVTEAHKICFHVLGNKPVVEDPLDDPLSGRA